MKVAPRTRDAPLARPHTLRALLAPRDYWKAVALVFCLVLAALAEGIGVGAVFPLLQMIGSPEVISQHTWLSRAFSYSRASSPEQFVILCSAALLLFFILKNSFLGFVAVYQARVVFAKESELESALIRNYLHAPYELHFDSNSAERIRVVTGEVNRVANGVLLPSLVLIAEGLVSAMIVIVLFMLQPVLTLVGLAAFVVVGGILVAAFRPTLSRGRLLRMSASSEMFKAAAQSLISLKEIKVFGREGFFTAAFSRPCEAHARASTTFTMLNVVPRLAVEGLLVSGLLVLIMISIMMKASSHEVLPTLALFGLASVRMLPSATRILSAVTTIRFYMPSVSTVAAELELTRTAASATLTGNGPEQLTTSTQRIATIELRHVSYRYPGAEREALRNISATINRGEVMAIIGRSGSGKTTLADIVLGLLKPGRGEILVNGRAVDSLRDECGPVASLVPQDCYVLDNTIKRNVAFGVRDDQIDEARVWKALELARLKGQVVNSPARLEMPVGENGVLLSGGERQRLIIARALYHDPSLMVFDEATSALDAVTEGEIVTTIREIATDKAVVVIAHRPALIQAADRILVLAEGQIIAAGRYDHLMANEPRFRSLVRDTSDMARSS